MIRVLDMFSGGGGVCLAVEQLRQGGLDIDVVWAANHWPAAVDLHRRRHPRTPVACQDLCQFDYRRTPATDIVWASSACQGHSEAAQPARAADHELAVAHDELRSTAWAVVNCVLAKSPQAFIVENVREFVEWAPPPRVVAIESTRAAAERRARLLGLERWRVSKRKDGYHVLRLFEPGSMYRHWLNTFRLAGYHVTEQVVSAASWGAPQLRSRLLIVGHLDGPVDVAEPTPDALATLKGVLDPGSGEWTDIEDMARPGAQARARHAHDLFHGAPCWGYHVSHRGAWGRPLTQPSTTITTQNQHWLVAGGRYRLWTVPEVARVMGMPSDYFDGVGRTNAIKMAGNAIVPAMGAGAIAQVADSITPRRVARRMRVR